MRTKEIIFKEIKDLLSINNKITKSGGFFTQDQIENERKICQLRLELRKKGFELVNLFANEL